MKKIAILILVVLLPLTLFGCGGSEEETATIDLTTPEGLTREYIRVVNNFEHSKATSYLTAEFNTSFVTLGETIRELKNYDVFTEEHVNNGPNVVKANDSKAIAWYEYESGKYVKFDLAKENGLWKIDMISYWSTEQQGSPDKVSLE